ncbi:S-phase kinase-associated protein 2 isoform X2 [Bombus bifarius]|uniref:S-phase kinase-associated protein 2 isoform X2 n=2 Tax=Pyrobombus TaxID=144703 RepID=A0A6P8LT72_9HYME|nr:S-phase kinase-associated protein 2 isoform X2 [Bombus vancouverensis nearcticus]XP_033301494.1 S-phase kinase-associated protein 2 isoform X2 [Bombus bifarius]
MLNSWRARSISQIPAVSRSLNRQPIGWETKGIDRMVASDSSNWDSSLTIVFHAWNQWRLKKGYGVRIPPKMNSVVAEHTRFDEHCLENSKESSPPESKQLRLDDSCNNNLNDSLNSTTKHSAKWSCSGDTSLVEPEILEEMGVSMLEDGASNCESTRKSHSLEQTISPTILDNNGQCKNMNDSQSQECIYRGSSLDTTSIDSLEATRRLDPNPYELDEFATYSTIGNESGYSSRVEIDNFIDTKETFSKDNLNVSTRESSLEQFYLYRRKRKPSILGEDKFNKLSDEMILMILKWLPKKCLVRSMLVCKRWCQIARDEALWSRLDLGSKVLNEGTLGHILPRGVQILRLAQAEIADPVFLENSEVLTDGYISKLQYFDLSMAVISPDGLAMLLSKCKYLKKLSLEKCTVNRSCCKAISDNNDLEILNLTMCEGMDIECIKDLMKLTNLNAVNMAWCGLDTDTMALLCKSLPSSVTRLNIAGCRKTITDDNVKDLVKSCPDMVELDLSDCTMLTMNTVRNLLDLSKLEHLSLSRCYGIPPSTYVTLAYMPSLLYLDVFGVIPEPVLKSLQVTCGETQLNKFLYSSVARPTIGVRRTSIWGLRVRD